MTGYVAKPQPFCVLGRKSDSRWIDKSSTVICPHCGAQFKSEAIRFFGFLSPKGLNTTFGIWTFVILFLALLGMIAIIVVGVLRS